MKTLVRLVVGLYGAVFGLAAAPFQNLDFESADIGSVAFNSPGDRFGYGPTTALLSGWTLSYGTEPVSIIGYNFPPLGDPRPSNQATLFSGYGGSFYSAEGNFALELWTAFAETSYSLSQFGEIPPDANYLYFKGYSVQPRVFFNGEPLQYLETGDPNFHSQYYSLAGYAGKSGKLEFVVDGWPYKGVAILYIDNIKFLAVPEPGTITLAVIGGALLAGTRWRKRR